MKILRILTGTHAGIQARLTPGRYRIGKDDDTDICITDWDDEEIVVDIDEAGIVRAQHQPEAPDAPGDADAPDAHPVVVLIPDFVPFPFGVTVLCFGNEDAAWPPDIQLLASMYNGDAAASASRHTASGPLAPNPARRTVRVIGAGAMLVAFLTAGATLVYARLWPSPGATGPRTAAALAQQINAALHDAKLADLHAQDHGATVVVDGIVSTSADDVAVRTLLARLGGNVARAYDVAQSDVASIQDSLGIDGLRVSYAGGGVFSINGAVPSLTQFRDGLNRLRADLDGNVRRIDVDVTEAPSTIPSLVYTSMMAVGDTRYVQTPDGVKHLFPGAPPDLGDGATVMRESVTPIRAQNR
ncbi:HrpD5 family protein [Burkholderia ambifaria]|jgi:type III secretion protein D|uniref:HrpD5 family protein n=1 Tax=Burkholderia ambifaria TaxID=152480 RepID=UPI000CFF6185|nr:HrpD5 family protein [Burkholderia ambifaria]PRG03965.1 type III secretion system protein [Burkholderia ambifaria]